MVPGVYYRCVIALVSLLRKSSKLEGCFVGCGEIHKKEGSKELKKKNESKAQEIKNILLKAGSKGESSWINVFCRHRDAQSSGDLTSFWLVATSNVGTGDNNR